MSLTQDEALSDEGEEEETSSPGRREAAGVDAGGPALRGSRKDRALAALLVEANVSAASKACGVPERTVRRWLRDDEAFGARVKAGRKDMMDAVIGDLRRGARQAVRTLQKIADSDKGSQPSRVAAARAVLAYTFKAIEIVDLEDRVESVERLVEQAEKAVAQRR